MEVIWNFFTKQIYKAWENKISTDQVHCVSSKDNFTLQLHVGNPHLLLLQQIHALGKVKTSVETNAKIILIKKFRNANMNIKYYKAFDKWVLLALFGVCSSLCIAL